MYSASEESANRGMEDFPKSSTGGVWTSKRAAQSSIVMQSNLYEYNCDLATSTS